MKKKIKAYKAFNSNFTCNEFKYEPGKTYEHDGDIALCRSGFHACENPLDVLNFYDLCDSKFAKVELNGKKKKDKVKICASKIKIEAELSLGEYVKECVDWLINACKSKASSGNYAQQASSGDHAQQASSGNYAQQASSGDGAKQASSGYGAQQASSGNCAQQASSGDFAQHEALGKNSVIASTGVAAKAKGIKGTWISLAEYKNGECIGFASGKVGEDGIPENVWLEAKDGKLVEV